MTDKAYNGLNVHTDDALWKAAHQPRDIIAYQWTPSTNFERVGEFMRAMDQECLYKARFPSEKVQKLRYDLIDEELGEFAVALHNQDIVGVADALTDLLYVVYGAGFAFGIDLDKCFKEVHRSNMTKLGPDGKAIRRDDGKVLKPETYSPPNLKEIVNAE
jgi:predicted HAD superfamily Cof-like phosphohydrolase